MNQLVVDASVAIKWYVAEVHSIQARRLLDEDVILVAPDLIHIEVANTLWKKVRRGEITDRDAVEILGAFLAVPIELFPSSPLLASALDIAVTFGRTVYDSLYLALAVERYSFMVTADEKFAFAIKATPLASHVRWVAEN